MENLLDSRVTEKGVTEYLVRWRGFSSDWDTWEPEGNIVNCEPIIKTFQTSNLKPKNSVPEHSVPVKKRGNYKPGAKVHCSRCEHWYASQYLYERHLRTDNCRQECHLCGKVFLHHRKESYINHLNFHARQQAENSENKAGEKLVKDDTKGAESDTDAVKLKPARPKAWQKKPKAAAVKVVAVKGQRKVKVVRNQKKTAITDKRKRKLSTDGDKKELIAVDDEVTLSVLRDNLSKRIALLRSEFEREAFVSAQMSEIFESVLSSTNQEESNQKVGKDKKRHSGEMERKKKVPVRKTRSVGSKMTSRTFRPRPVDKNKPLNTDTKNSQVSPASSLKKPLKLKDNPKSKKATQQKVGTVEETASDKDVKKRSPKSNKSDPLLEVVKKRDTSKLDELFNHLMEQVRAATPPIKHSKHTVVSVKNVLKSGNKPKVPSPKSSPVKSNKAASSLAIEPKKSTKDSKDKKDKQANIQLIRVDMPKSSKPVDSKEKGKTKTVKSKSTKTVTEQTGKRKQAAGQKRKASGDVVIETDDESNSDDGVLYSLSDMEENDSTPTQSPEDVGKQKSTSTSIGIVAKDLKDVLKAKNKKVVKVVKSQSESGVEKSQKPKKMRLLDSLTKQPPVVKPGQYAVP